MLEILAPAGSMDSANAAIDNGANALYLGLADFSARQNAENFDTDGLSNVLRRAHFCGVKVYVAMNTIVKDGEVEDFLAALVNAWNMGVDAIIMQDIFLGKLVKSLYPDIVLHLSTQAGVCTVEGALLAKEYGFSRVILARETPFTEIERIAKIIETEAFVQGALCTAFSGQCYFSSFVGGNSGNRGRCKQPCRKVYAYNRNGNGEKTYALSLSDLCVGENVEKLIAAGVVSFKIEGRMRRAEYVAAAVRYYRALLDNQRSDNALLSDLKRTYNRGNYTQGLAFGQDKRLLSTAIQGHLGEKVGVVKVVNGKFTVESSFKPRLGDAFKILRDGKEVAGATFVSGQGKGFVISSKLRLKNGDGVFVTTDTAVNERVLSPRKTGKLFLRLYFHEGEPPKAACGEYIFVGEKPLQTAQNRPLSIEELQSCFLKTDGLPAEISFTEMDLQGEIFLPKSELNAFRRAFYEGLSKRMSVGENRQCAYTPITSPRLSGTNEKTAVISSDFNGLQADIFIYKPSDLRNAPPESFLRSAKERYLYYPAFATQEDLSRIAELCAEYRLDGVYAENYAGLQFAKAHAVKLFAGVGFHILNAFSLETLLQEENVAYYVISKEANGEEARRLGTDKGFALSLGDIKLMDLCYCPFGRTCANCDEKEIYTLTDEGGRSFPVRRYLASDGSCRFEVYNCASMIGTGAKGVGKLLDLSVTENKIGALTAKEDEEGQKLVYRQYTSGHWKRGVL